MTDKELLVNSVMLTVLSTDIKNVEELKTKLLSSLAEYTVVKLESICPSTVHGEVTRDLFLKFSQEKYNQGMNRRAIKQYWMAVRNLVEFCQKEAHMVTSDDINNYLTFYRATGVKSTTIKNKRMLLSSFYTYLFNNHYIEENPIVNVSPIKAKSDPKKPLTKKEIEKLLFTCEEQEGLIGYRNRAIVTFMLETGVRAAELCGIKISDVNFDDKTLMVEGKGHKVREIYFTDATLVRLQEYFTQRGKYTSESPLFANVNNDEPITVSGLEYIIKTIGAQSGITRVHPHLLRANFATHLLEKNVPMVIISELMGHSNISTTQIYTRMSNDSKKKYIEFVS